MRVLCAICKDEIRWYDWGLGALFCEVLLSGSNGNVYFLVIIRFLAFHMAFARQLIVEIIRFLMSAFHMRFTKPFFLSLQKNRRKMVFSTK